MQGLPRFDDDPDLLVGTDHFSDAGVYRLADGLAIVQSVDFFPPLVDDPYTFGRIAATNALSDLAAMGARPRTALNIISFPDDQLPLSIMGDILRGGADQVRAAGAVVLGGHSTRDPGIMYGLAVTGVVDPARMLTNRGAKPNDVLVLTKPLGTGFVSTAHRRGACPVGVMDAAVSSMTRLNLDASGIAVELGASAATDITGFGLAGHAMEMAMASGVSIELRLDDLPRLDGTAELIAGGFLSRANHSNAAHVADHLLWTATDTHGAAPYLFDPQTSGGLLIAVDAAVAPTLVERCRAAGDPATVIGRVLTRSDRALTLS